MSSVPRAIPDASIGHPVAELSAKGLMSQG